MINFTQHEVGDKRDIIMFTQRNAIKEACGLIASLDNEWVGSKRQFNDADYYMDLMDTANVSFNRVINLIQENEKSIASGN